MLNPTLLIEVQGPSTEADDKGAKLDGYKLIDSVRSVVLVAQDRVEVTLHVRRPDGSWAEATHRDGTVEVPAIGCSLPLSEIYEALPET